MSLWLFPGDEESTSGAWILAHVESLICYYSMLGANLIELLYARADLLCSIIIPSEIFLRKGNTKKGIGSTTFPIFA